MWKFSRVASKPAQTTGVGGERSDLGVDGERAYGVSAARIRRTLAQRSATWWIVGLALVLTSTSLTLGLTGDDYLHKLMVRDDPGVEGLERDAINLFTFATGDREELRGLRDEGLVPWWASPNLRLAFFRPLSSLTHQLDYRLWPERPVLMHLHSMLWFALLLVVVGAVQRRFLDSPWVAGLALFLYAVDDARAAPVGWLSNRNAMIATIPPLLALLAHDRHRSHGDKRAAVLAPLLFAIGLAAGEPAVSAGAYLLAYTFCLDRGSVRDRLLSLLPYAGVVVVWRVFYALGHYGVRGSSMYIDPTAHPALFLETLLVRLPLLLLAEFALPWAEFWDLLPVVAPALRPAMLVLALGVVATTVFLLWPLLRKDAQVRFWAVGALLATIPACAAVPNDRLLTATGVGGAALIARFIAAVVDRTYPRERRRVGSAAAAGLVAVHALFAPLVLPFRTKAVDGLEVLMRRADKSIPSTPEMAERTVVLINPPVDPMPIYFAGYRQAKSIPRPRYLRWLATGVEEIRVTRVDAHTLALRPSGGYLTNSSQWMLRGPEHRSFVGETVELADCTVTVRSVTDDGRPLDVHFRFREPLESPRYSWLQWGRHEYVGFRPPAPGQSLTVPAVDMKAALLGLGLSDS